VGTSVIAIVVESIKNATFLDFMKAYRVNRKNS